MGSSFGPASNDACISIANDNVYFVVSRNLCHYGCECYLSGTITPGLEPFIVEYSTTHESKPVRYQDCPQFQNSGHPALYSKMEEEYDCSGWCKGYPIKLFSDVNLKVDKSNKKFQKSSSCYEAHLDSFPLLTNQQHCIYCNINLFCNNDFNMLSVLPSKHFELQQFI